jgi:hypothetical protein
MTINVTGDSEAKTVPVRRRNPQGSETELVSASIPKELAQTINGIVVKTRKSRSLVISELIEKGLKV